jgi:hypothetical protein
MTDDKQFNNFEATVILRKAMAMKKINIEDDPLYKQLEEAKWEREVTKYLFTGLGTTMNLMILYGNRYRMGLPWVQIVGRMSGVIAFWTFFYWTSPGVRKYNQVLIDISKGKKKELLDLFQPSNI